MRFVVVGDATVDIIVRSAAAATPGSDHPAHIRVGTGGQGANLAVRLARRGADVTLVAALADDSPGRELRAVLDADRVVLVPLPAARTGAVVSMVDSHGERAMLSDRVSFDVDALTSAPVRTAVEWAAWLHVSGYPLADPVSGEVLAGLAGGRPRGQHCSVGGGSFAHGTDAPARLREARPDLLLFDRAEASTILSAHTGNGGVRGTEIDSAEALAGALAGLFGAVAVVTDGAAGAAGSTADGSLTVAGMPGVAIDATGAGDAHAAAVIHSVATGTWPPSQPILRAALETAGRLGAEVAGVMGAQARVASERES